MSLEDADRPGDPAPPPTPAPAYVVVHVGDDPLPSLDFIAVDELVDVVVARAGVSRSVATGAVHRGVLCAGYRTGSDSVTAADAFAIVEDAVRFRA